jgi:hypothetical protein
VPNLSKTERETSYWAFTLDRLRFEDRFGIAAGPEYFDRAALGIYKPAEVCTVADPFTHLAARYRQAV